MCSITATSLSVIYVIYGTVNHFETVVHLSFLTQFHMFSLSFYSPRVFEVFILSSLRAKRRTIQTCLNLILYISILVLYANHFWLHEIV